MVVEDREACSSVGSNKNGVGVVFVHCIPCFEVVELSRDSPTGMQLVEPGAVSGGGGP
jgi:hypothetical protein